MHFFFVLSWTSSVTYYLLGLLVDYSGQSPRDMSDFERQSYISIGPGKESVGQLLFYMGFSHEPKLYPQSYHESEDNLPIFVSTVSSESLHNFQAFLHSFRSFYQDKKLVIYDLDLSTEEHAQVSYRLQLHVYPIS